MASDFMLYERDLLGERSLTDPACETLRLEMYGSEMKVQTAPTRETLGTKGTNALVRKVPLKQ